MVLATTSRSPLSRARSVPAPASNAPSPRVAEEPLEATVVLVGPTTYEIRRRDDVVGYIDIVGGVYVALAGARYDHAVEVRQSVVLDAAIAALS